MKHGDNAFSHLSHQRVHVVLLGALLLLQVTSSGSENLTQSPWFDEASCLASARQPACFDNLFPCHECCERGHNGPQGLLRCWSESYDYKSCCPTCPKDHIPSCFHGESNLTCDRCCDLNLGPRGDESCWASSGPPGPVLGYDRCCLGYEAICTTVAGTTAVQASQIGQDRFALHWLGCPSSGFYLDLGSYDGKHLSNTYSMDVHLGWRGICVDFNLRREQFQGRSCELVQALLHEVSGVRHFVQRFQNHAAGPFGRILGSSETVPAKGGWDEVFGPWYQEEVESLTVDDVLMALTEEKYFEVPEVIDFVSLDIEGVALQALRGFPFQRHCVRLWAIELEAPVQNEDARSPFLELVDHLAKNDYILVDGIFNPFLDIERPGSQDFMFAHRDDCGVRRQPGSTLHFPMKRRVTK